MFNSKIVFHFTIFFCAPFVTPQDHVLAFNRYSFNSLQTIALAHGPLGVTGRTLQSHTKYIPELSPIDIEEIPLKKTKTSTLRSILYSAKFAGSLLLKPFKLFAYDMGLNKTTKQEPSLINDIKVGMRLFVYQKLISMILLPIMLPKITATDITTGPAQFEQMPPFWASVIVGPVCEEIVFTYLLTFICGSITGTTPAQIIVPILFGLLHSHQNQKLQLFAQTQAGLVSFLSIRNLYCHPHNKFASIATHIFQNGYAYLLS